MTMVELSAAIAISMLMLAASVYSGMTRIRSARWDNAVQEARSIAQTVDERRRSLNTSVANPDGSYSYTYYEEPSWIPAATWNGKHGGQLPTKTVWGTNYEVRGTGDGPAQARFVVPYDPIAIPPKATLTSAGGPSRTLTVWAEQRVYVGNMVMNRFRKELLEESARR